MVSPERFPKALDRICVESYPNLIKQGAEKGWISEKTALLIATDRQGDLALQTALGTTAGYIGLLGSRKEIQVFSEIIMKSGFSEEDLSRVNGPVGLDLGTETPEEVALSILAEIIKKQSGKSGKSLSLFGQ